MQLPSLISKYLTIAALSCVAFINLSCISNSPTKMPRHAPQKRADRSIKIDAFSEALAGFESKSMVSEKDIDEAFVYKSGRVQIQIPWGDAVVSTGLTSLEILTVVREHLNAMRLCYEKELKNNQTISCNIKPNFSIDLDGKPVQIKFSDSHNCSQVFVQCFSDVMSSMRFPKPRSGEPIQVSYPFVFSPI